MTSGSAYAALITSEHNQQPKFMALVGLLTDGIGDLVQGIEAIQPAFDLDLAVGSQLDVLGLWIGHSRVITNVLIQGFFGFADNIAALPFGEVTDRSIGGRFYEQGTPFEGSTVVGDATYRTILNATIVRNQFNGTEDQMDVAMFDILGVTSAITDNGTLSLSIAVGAPLSPVEQTLFTTLDLLPRPAGIAIGSITYHP